MTLFTVFVSAAEYHSNAYVAKRQGEGRKKKRGVHKSKNAQQQSTAAHRSTLQRITRSALFRESGLTLRNGKLIDKVISNLILTIISSKIAGFCLRDFTHSFINYSKVHLSHLILTI